MSSVSPTETTFDQVAEYCLEILIRSAVLPQREFRPDWPAFSRLSEKVHAHFDIPNTTFTPVMRHVLYLVASYVAPRAIVAAGTYVGYTLAWLVRDAADQGPAEPPLHCVGLDINAEAVSIAERNCCVLGHGERLRLVVEDAVCYLQQRSTPLDCLYIDIDAPCGRKDIYLEVLQAAMAALRPGAIILAHDPCVAMFAGAFERYHGFIREQSNLVGPIVLPVDECGLSVARIV